MLERLNAAAVAAGFSDSGTPFSQDPQAGLPNADGMILGILLFSVVPPLILTLSSFARIVVVLSFLRRAIGTPEIPPTSVVTGLSLALSLSIMAPTLEQIRAELTSPRNSDRAAQMERIERHVRDFMFGQVVARDVRMFLDPAVAAKEELVRSDVPTQALLPAFVVSEMRRAFLMGFMLFLPFVAIDLIIAASLTSMGLGTVSPSLVALPFKVLLFVMVDGWNLVVGSIVTSFDPALVAVSAVRAIDLG